MFSAGWCFEQSQYSLGGLALVSALACCRALERIGVNIQIKWPNDLVVGGEKLGGILIETVSRQGKTAAVIGIGMFALPAGILGAGFVEAIHRRKKREEAAQKKEEDEERGNYCPHCGKRLR